MYTWLICSVALFALLAAGFQGSAARVEMGAAAYDAKSELDLYRAFVFAAAQYMTVTPPTGRTHWVSWDEMRSSPGIPPGLIRAGIPARWRLQVAGDGSWVACTELSERTATAIAQWAPVIQEPPGHLVVGASTSNEALARQCDN
jgi:hypothetical protein